MDLQKKKSVSPPSCERLIYHSDAGKRTSSTPAPFHQTEDGERDSEGATDEIFYTHSGLDVRTARGLGGDEYLFWNKETCLCLLDKRLLSGLCMWVEGDLRGYEAKN